MGSWFSFKQLPEGCGTWLAAGSSAYADDAGGYSNG